MGMFSKISSMVGWDSGSKMRKAISQLSANFDLINQDWVDSGAADYVPALTDRNITRSRATAQTLTLPLNATTAFPIGTRLTILQTGAGILTIQGAGGVTVNKLAAKSLATSQWGVVTLRKISANVWVATGDLT